MCTVFASEHQIHRPDMYCARLHSHGFNDQINTGTDDVGLCAQHTHTRFALILKAMAL